MKKALLIISLALIGVIAFSINLYHVKDYARFHFWALTHTSEMEAASRHAKVLTPWDSWGFAGMDNDRYLVSDPGNELSNAISKRKGQQLPEPQSKVAESWRRTHGLNCDIVWVDRIQTGFYLIETYNCTLPANGQAGEK